MSKAPAQAAVLSAPYAPLVRNASLVIAASVFMAICARLSLPLPFTPVPLTLGNFAVLLIGLVLGSRRGMAALFLYLAQGAIGLPVFSHTGPGGMAQLLGPTGGYLMAYPLAAFAAGWLSERRNAGFPHLAFAAAAGETILLAGGVAWLVFAWQASLPQAASLGVYPFLFAEVIKVMSAAALAARLPRFARDGSRS
ncbi:MAG: biotin transporter BioY [Candidatus Korobacteraceae bacterium]